MRFFLWRYVGLKTNAIYLLRKSDIILKTKFRYDINSLILVALATYRAARHIECNAHIANSAGIYIAAECPEGHSAYASCVFIFFFISRLYRMYCKQVQSELLCERFNRTFGHTAFNSPCHNLYSAII